MSTDDWGQPTTARDQLRQWEKRLTAQERRAAVTDAAGLVGPGIAARAIQLLDWNDESATFNGFFYSLPGARNAPEVGFEWNGIVTARADGSGNQSLTNPTGTAESLTYVRTFKQHPDDPTITLWGPWKKFGTHSGSIGMDDLDEPVVVDIGEALDNAAAALGFAESTIRVFRQDDPPVPGVDGAPAEFLEGWTWFDTNDSNHIYVWDEATNAWVEPDAPFLADLEAAIADAQAAADAALADAAAATAAAASKNTVFYQTTMPTSGILGDIWFDTDDGKRMYVHNGTTFADPALTLVNAAIRNPYNAGTGVSPTVVPGVVIGTSGIGLYANTGITMFADASTGAFTAKGDITSGSTVTGAIVTGGTIQTESTAARGIKMTSTGLIGYDGSGVATFGYVAATGAITLKGTLQSGSNIAGATLTGILQTSASANTGIKMSNSGFFAYSTSNVLVTTISTTDGTITTAGSVLTGGEVNGAIVTGGTVQTDGTFNRGVKMNTSGLAAYDGSGNATFVITGSTGAITMAGGVLSGGTITGSAFSSGPASSQRIYMTDESSSGVAFLRLTYDLGEPLGDSGGIGSFSTGTPHVQVSSGKYGSHSGDCSISLTPTTTAVGTITMNGTVEFNYGMLIDPGFVYMPATGVQAGGAGAWRAIMVDSGGLVRRSSTLSSMRYKEDVETLDGVGEAVLGIDPVTFAYRADAPVDERELTIRHKGLIAERLHDEGLGGWVYYDDEGRPNEVDYYSWSLAVHAAVRHVNKKFTEKIEGLEARLAAAGI